MTITPKDLPTYASLMYPVLQAVQSLGGSASGRELIDKVLETQGFTDEQIAVTYASRDKSVIIDRLEWARSYCKLTGALESPARKLYLLSTLGHSLLEMPEAEGRAQLAKLDRDFRALRARKPKIDSETDDSEIDDSIAELATDVEDNGKWREELLGRLHLLTPDGFEEFCLYLLRLFGLELERRGGTGDEGIDGIGIAPLSEVLSATVAVQVKRYDPTKGSIGREVVALFQRDASAAGAERAILISLSRFSAPARKAASSVMPHVDLIDGERLCDLVLSKEVGVSRVPVVQLEWFNRFD